eukprot:365627-Pelagomonas_calceolata.AAC.3
MIGYLLSWRWLWLLEETLPRNVATTRQPATKTGLVPPSIELAISDRRAGKQCGDCALNL